MKIPHPARCLAIAAFIALWLSPGAYAQSSAPASTSSIVGAWTLNRDLSDQPQDRSQSGDGRRTDGGTGGGRRGGGGFGGRRRGGGGFGGGQGAGGNVSPGDAQRMRDAMRAITDAPDRLTITQGDSLVIITTGDGRTTRLSPNGKKVKEENTKIERKTKWDSGKLVSEINGLGPNKITETYAVDDERHQLSVTVLMDASRGQQPVTVHRVYDAAAR